MGDTEEIETLTHHQYEGTVAVINDKNRDELVGASALCSFFRSIGVWENVSNSY